MVPQDIEEASVSRLMMNLGSLNIKRNNHSIGQSNELFNDLETTSNNKWS